jgi:hypothetical protein
MEPSAGAFAFAWIVIKHDFSADEGFEWEGGEHIEAEAEACNVHHGVGRRKVIEDVSLCFGAEG